MIDGLYQIKVDSPLGPKQGTVALHTMGDVVTADIDAPVVGKQRIEGRREGEGFAAEGALKLLFVGKVAYSLRGEVVGDNLLISIDSNKGALELRGTRV